MEVILFVKILLKSPFVGLHIGVSLGSIDHYYNIQYFRSFQDFNFISLNYSDSKTFLQYVRSSCFTQEFHLHFQSKIPFSALNIHSVNYFNVHKMAFAHLDLTFQVVSR